MRRKSSCNLILLVSSIFLPCFSVLADEVRTAQFVTSPQPAAEKPQFQIAGDIDPEISRSLAEALEQFSAEFRETFSRSGFDLAENCGRLEWRCFTGQEAYADYAASSGEAAARSLPAYYSTRTNRVALMAGAPRIMQAKVVGETSGVLATSIGQGAVTLPKIRHELAHQLAFNTGLQTRGVMYPFWLSEGLAAAFEHPLMNESASVTDNNVRLDALRHAWTSGRLWTVREAVGITECPQQSETQALEAYGQSWAFFRFLYFQRREQLRQYMAHLGELPRGERSPQQLRREFETSFGNLSDLQSEYTGYLLALMK